jgi:hypothetical protein
MHAHASAVLHCWGHARAHVRARCLSLSSSLLLSLTHEVLTHELSLSLSLRERERERERENDRERERNNPQLMASQITVRQASRQSESVVCEQRVSVSRE